MDTLDQRIKELLTLRHRQRKAKGREEVFQPSAEDLYRFVTNDLEGKEFQRMIDHLRRCPEDQALVVRARELIKEGSESEKEAVPPAWVERARKIFPSKAGARKQRVPDLWFLAASALAFGGSFVWKRYFLQWLALALFFGFQWVMARRASKTQVVIYKALKDKDVSSEGQSRISSHLPK